jgi:hypothetical protein
MCASCAGTRYLCRCLRVLSDTYVAGRLIRSLISARSISGGACSLTGRSPRMGLGPASAPSVFCSPGHYMLLRGGLNSIECVLACSSRLL